LRDDPRRNTAVYTIASVNHAIAAFTRPSYAAAASAADDDDDDVDA